MRSLNTNLQVLGVQDVRETNEMRLLHLIRDRQPVSRADLIKETGLRPGTVSVVVNRLLKSELIYEAEEAPSKGGRRAVYLQVNAEKAYAVGVSVGVQQSVYVVSDFNGRVLSQRSLPSEREAAPFFASLGREIANHLKADYANSRFAGIGVSVPGLVDRDNGVVVSSPNLGWLNVPVRQLLENEVKLPVQVENDANAAALSELWYGPLEASRAQSLLFVLVVDGIGTGFILNGELHIGSSIGSGGFGHISMDPSGPLCSCGNIGCWEALAADPATVKRFQNKSPKLASLVRSVHDIIALAVNGESSAVRQIRETATLLGRGIRGLAQGLTPEVIVVGGEITEAWPLIESTLKEELRSGYLIEGLSLPQLRRASTENPSLFGAIPLALRSVLKNEKRRFAAV
ncbi:MAG: ROK family transcriptional regulator [Acidobacteriota bacterium]|nr:ROK family transcriptional regulator [Acidobacteriota bacterium]